MKDCVTETAAEKLLSPAWLATSVHVPAVSIVTVNSDTVHTPVVVDVNVTVRFEFDVAVTVNGVAENDLFTGSAKVIDCVPCVMLKDPTTFVATEKLLSPA